MAKDEFEIAMRRRISYLSTRINTIHDERGPCKSQGGLRKMLISLAEANRALNLYLKIKDEQKLADKTRKDKKHSVLLQLSDQG